MSKSFFDLKINDTIIVCDEYSGVANYLCGSAIKRSWSH